MGEFFHKYNTDNVHSRAVIVGFVNLLNNKVFFENILSDTVVDTVYVPFYYSMTGDERFLQDYFLEWNDCVHPRHADGNYDVIPRGIVTLSSKSIDTAKLTHRFVRGNYVKMVNGQLQTFSSYINSLPIQMTFDVEVRADSNLDAFKIEQALTETFYKNQVFSVTYKGFRIPCQAGFAEDYSVNRTFEFSYADDTQISVKFSVDVETYFPVLDSTTERNNATRMTSINIEENWPEVYKKPRITFTGPKAGETYFSDSKMPISWSNTGPMLKVNLYYRVAGTADWIPIVKNLINDGSYDWMLPFFNSSGVVIKNEPQTATVVSSSTGENAKVRPIIDSTGAVDKIVVLDKGFAYDDNEMIEVNIFPKPLVLPPTFVAPVIQAETVDGSVIGANVVSPGSGFTPTPTTAIELKIQDSNNEDVYQVLSNRAEFTGDVDPSAAPPGNTYITNLVPTVSDLLTLVPLTNQTVTGIGIPSGAKIVNFNAALNRVEINTATNYQTTGETYTLSAYDAKVFVQ